VIAFTVKNLRRNVSGSKSKLLNSLHAMSFKVLVHGSIERQAPAQKIIAHESESPDSSVLTLIKEIMF